MISEVKDLNDVVLFMNQLFDEGTNAHPDDDFSNYINTETNEPAYSIGEAELRNHLMRQCFGICKDAKLGLYDITQEIFLKRSGLDQWIPLPSLKI